MEETSAQMRKAKDMLIGYQEASSQWHSIASAAPSPKRQPTPDTHPALPPSPKAPLVHSLKPSVVTQPAEQLPSGPLASLSLTSSGAATDSAEKTPLKEQPAVSKMMPTAAAEALGSP